MFTASSLLLRAMVNWLRRSFVASTITSREQGLAAREHSTRAMRLGCAGSVCLFGLQEQSLALTRAYFLSSNSFRNNLAAQFQASEAWEETCNLRKSACAETHGIARPPRPLRGVPGLRTVNGQGPETEWRWWGGALVDAGHRKTFGLQTREGERIDLRRSFQQAESQGPRPSDGVGSRGQQRGHVTTELATLVTRTSDVCAIRSKRGRRGSYSLGGATAASTWGSDLPRPQAQHDSGHAFGWSPLKATSC